MEIIFEDDNYLILNKPAGALVHSDGRTREAGRPENVTDWLSQKYPDLENIGGQIEVQHGTPVKRWGLVHRIDRETSGVLVVAKDQIAFADLQKKFQDRKVKKTYHAFVYGRVTADHEVIESPIGRSKTDFRRWSTGADARGALREAVTEYRVIHKSNEATFIEVMPRTGRTHQIRVHLRSIGHPVVCDSVYAPLRKGILGFERLALHALSISFKNIDNEPIFASAPYPQDFIQAIKELGVAK